MYLLEFQGKELFAQKGLPLPKAEVVNSPDAAREATERLGKRAVIKAQVHSGGRGKAGLVKIVSSSEEAFTLAKDILGVKYKGEIIEQLLVEELLDIEQEFYLGISLDNGQGCPVVLVSARGGMDIEALAKNEPEAIHKLALDPTFLPSLYELSDLGRKLGLKGKKLLSVRDMLWQIVQMFYEMDALTVEINPAVRCRDGRLIAADAKVIIDDAALGRHKEIVNWTVVPDDSELKEAHKHNLGFVRLDENGEVGIIAGGAGLCLASMDTVIDLGGRPASFLDLGGGISAEQMAAALEITLRIPSLKGILVNVYGGINNCFIMAQGIVKVLDKLVAQNTRLVVKMRGHSQDEGWELLEKHNLSVVKNGTTKEAVFQLLTQIKLGKEAELNGHTA